MVMLYSCSKSLVYDHEAGGVSSFFVMSAKRISQFETKLGRATIQRRRLQQVAKVPHIL